MKKNITVTKMNEMISKSQNGPWEKHTCKETALAGRAKKLAPKVNSICKVMGLDPDEVSVLFSNVKPVGMTMYDKINLKNDFFHMDVEFHNASKSIPGYVSLMIGNKNTDNVTEEASTWKELKANLANYIDMTVESEEEEDEICEEEEECSCDKNCQCDESEEEETEVEEEEEEVESEEEEEPLPFADELDENYNEEYED